MTDPRPKPERRHKTLHELTPGEHFDRIRAQRAGRAWEPPLTDAAVAHDRKVAAAADRPDPHPERKRPADMNPAELADYLNRNGRNR